MATPSSDATDALVRRRDFTDGPQRTGRNRSSLTFAQEAFAQTKLTELYVKTCGVLQPHKYLVDTFQETILWRQPLLSVLLYLCVHATFWYLYFTEASVLTLVADVAFWVLLADAFLVVANRHKTNDARSPRTRSETSQRQSQLMSYEEAYSTAHSKPNYGEIVPLEVVCLWLAEVLLWCNAFKLAIKHWNNAQPMIMGFFIIGAGVICLLVGYFVSVITIAYLAVLTLLLYPVVIFYDMVARLSLFVDTNYPIFATKFQRCRTQLVNLYQSFTKLLKPPPDSDFRDLQLLPNANGQQSQQLAAAGSQAPNAQAMPTVPYQSITLPPFESLAPHIDPYDSLSSLIPQAEGFQSINSYLGVSTSSTSGPLSHSPNLDSIAEDESQEGITSEAALGNLEAETGLPMASEPQTEATALDPFPGSGHDIPSDSPDMEESGPVAIAAIENLDRTSPHAVEPGSGTAPSGTDPYQPPPELVYVAGDRPPPYSADQSTSPLFAGRFDSPPVPGAKVTQPMSSSTPLDRDESRQATLRQRDIRRDSNT